MSELSRAQKIRLGVFLLMAALLAALTVLVKVGSAAFESPDRYYLHVAGDVGGLQPGADVTYNGIVVGKVHSVGVDEHDVGKVRVALDLREGTPVPADTTAAVELTGITGLRRVDLSGGSNAARRRKPGEDIPARQSLFDEVVSQVRAMSERLRGLTEQVARLTSDDNVDNVEATFANVARASRALAQLAEDSVPRVRSLLGRAEAAVAGVEAALGDIRQTVRGFDRVLGHADTVVMREVGPLMTSARTLLERAGGMVERADGVLGRVDVAIGRTQGDIRRVLIELADGIVAIADLAELLRRNPSSLIHGKSPAER